MAQYLDLIGTRKLVELFIERYSVNSAIAFKAAVETISLLPNVSGCRPGDLYVVIEDGVTTDDPVVNPIQTYYKRTLTYQSYVFYSFSSSLSAWVARTENDTITSISDSEIDSIFS